MGPSTSFYTYVTVRLVAFGSCIHAFHMLVRSTDMEGLEDGIVETIKQETQHFMRNHWKGGEIDQFEAFPQRIFISLN